MTAIIQVCLWLFVLSEIYDLILPIIETMKQKTKYKEAINIYMYLSETTDDDFQAGFFYGKAKQFEQKLKETRFFDYE